MLVLLLSLACAPPDTDSGTPGPGFDYPLDDQLRLGHHQVIGTHNSYHLEPETPLDESWEYSHAPLDVQLSDQGVRQFELDVHWNPELDRFEVYHVPIVDEETTCLAWTDCLGVVRDWSDRNPGHLPVMILVEPKNEGATVPWEERIPEFETELDSVWPLDRRLSPDALQGDAASLREAILDRGWPSLGELRGKVLFTLLDHEAPRDLYTQGGTSLAGRAMFADMEDPTHPLASVLLYDDAIGEAARTTAAVSQGFLVRSRADSAKELAAALASGAHMISTDHPPPAEGDELVIAIPGGTPARCNPVTAPKECSSEDLEDPAWIR